MSDWSKQNTLTLQFADVPTGTMFAYASSGAIRPSRNVFTKVEPYTASAPNAVSAASAKLKLWFDDVARVRIQKPSWWDESHTALVEDARKAAYEQERVRKDRLKREAAAINRHHLSGDHDLRVCGGLSADRAESRLVAELLRVNDDSAWRALVS